MKDPDTWGPREIPFAGLVAFEATARHGSMSAAADELNLTQSAISQRIARLEDYTGQPLFLRQGRGVRLTGAGELLMRTATETLQRLRTGFDRIEPYRSKASLLLACPPDFAHGWLMPRLAALRERTPALEVWLMDDRAFDEIDRVDVDLIVSRQPRHAPEIDCRPLCEERAIAVCGPRLAAKLQGAAWPRVVERAPLLFLEKAPAWGGVLDDPRVRADRLQRAATIEDERLLLAAIEQDLGLGQVGELVAAGALAAGRVVALPQVPAMPRARLWLMRSRLSPRTALANEAFEWLLAEAGAVPAATGG